MLKVEIKKSHVKPPLRFKDIPVGSVFKVIALDANPGNFFLKTLDGNVGNSFDLIGGNSFAMFEQATVKLVTSAKIVIEE